MRIGETHAWGTHSHPNSVKRVVAVVACNFAVAYDVRNSHARTLRMSVGVQSVMYAHWHTSDCVVCVCSCAAVWNLPVAATQCVLLSPFLHTYVHVRCDSLCWPTLLAFRCRCRCVALCRGCSKHRRHVDDACVPVCYIESVHSNACWIRSSEIRHFRNNNQRIRSGRLMVTENFVVIHRFYFLRNDEIRNY